MAGSRSLGQLTLDLILGLGGFTAGWTKAQRDTAKGAASLQKTLNGVKNAFGAALGALGVAELLHTIVEHTSEAEKAFALLSNAVKTSGGAAGFTADQLHDLAEELQSTTTYSHEAIEGAEQLLLRFQSIKGTNFTEAVKSTIDLATALGKDLNSAALLVGKALENPSNGMKQLARAGVVLQKEQEDTIKRLAATGHAAEAQALLISELKKRYEGAAEAARNTLGGALEGLKHAFGDLFEAKGGDSGAIDAINDLTKALSDPTIKEGIATLVNGILTLTGAFVQFAAGAAGFSKWLGETFAALNNGPAEGDLVRLSDGIVELQDEIKNLKSLGGIGTALHGGAAAVSNEIAGYEKQIDELTKKYNAAQEAAVAALHPKVEGGNAATPTVVTHSEEFLKMEEHLKEQIALFGKTGEAAKLSAKIQAGALDDMSQSEQDSLMALARAYDDLAPAVGHVLTNQEEAAVKIGDSWAYIREQVEETIKASTTAVEGSQDLAAQLTPDFEAMLDKNLDTYKENVDKQNEYQLEAARNTQDILASSFEDAMNGSFDNVLKSFGQLIEKLVAQALAADVAGKLFGTGKDAGTGGLVGKGLDWLTGLFGKAGGGPVNAGHMYRVNEQGMETLSIPGKADYLMMGGSSGSITPANATGGGRSGVVQNIYVTGSVSERTARQLAIESTRRQRAVMRLS